tara:strand:- start:12 stop:602 length:591 start_codon:yes stop_codon:yes gene_type:complete
MDYIYLVEMNEEEVYKTDDREQAYDFINEEYSDTLDYLEYETYNLGQLEVWKNKLLVIRLVEKREGIFDTYKLLESHQSLEKKNKTREIKITSNIMTPKRTRIKNKKNKKNMEKAEKGKKYTDENGENWVAKKGRDGIYKWEKHHQKTYDSKKNSKRKCPEDPAKYFDEGIKKKGMDGKNWVVKKDKNGNKKWMKI